MTLEFSAESGREDGFGAEAALSSSGSGPGLVTPAGPTPVRVWGSRKQRLPSSPAADVSM